MLDEPSMGLAPRMVTQVYQILAELKAQGTTILLVEQNARAALKVADRRLRDRDRTHYPGRHRRGSARRPGSPAGLFGQGISGSVGIKDGGKGEAAKREKGG